jgi:hypothetical protein
VSFTGEVSSIAGPAAARSQDFILNKRESDNTLVVEDGEIAVIGGLLDENERRTIEKIPLLGDLPLIGNLFRSRGRDRGKTNLMIFVRPDHRPLAGGAARGRGAALRLYSRPAAGAEPAARTLTGRAGARLHGDRAAEHAGRAASGRRSGRSHAAAGPGRGGAGNDHLASAPGDRGTRRAASADAARCAAATSAGAAQMKIGRGQEVVLEEGDLVVEPAVDTAPAEAPMPVRIPYAFARKHGVVLVGSTNGHLKVAMREGADPSALIELRRWLARPFAMEFVAREPSTGCSARITE